MYDITISLTLKKYLFHSFRYIFFEEKSLLILYLISANVTLFIFTPKIHGADFGDFFTALMSRPWRR